MQESVSSKRILTEQVNIERSTLDQIEQWAKYGELDPLKSAVIQSQVRGWRERLNGIVYRDKFEGSAVMGILKSEKDLIAFVEFQGKTLQNLRNNTDTRLN
ncbi:hypothetical protein KAR91_35765 [Candidatus Pacearchaeota archaeon]|nr:hypothetical protein [Candidatus Pacearchaeota archaeon]